MTELTPDHPLLLQGRRHAREALFSAERAGRMLGGADKASAVSMALQFVVSAAMVDGTDPAIVYSGIAAALIWSLNKLPAEDRATVMAGIGMAVADGVEFAAPETIN